MQLQHYKLDMKLHLDSKNVVSIYPVHLLFHYMEVGLILLLMLTFISFFF